MDAVLQALADPSRRTVLEILRDHPATAGELADALPIARPGVSRHLRVLREAGLVCRTAVCVVDREEGGADALARKAVRLVPIFTATDILPG